MNPRYASAGSVCESVRIAWLVGLLVVGLLVGLSVDLVAASSGPIRSGSVTSGPELDYQSSVVRVVPSGELLVVFERINPVTFFGDLWVTSSADEGHTWSAPQEIIDSTRNERHPALVQLAPNGFALFFLVDESGGGSYRIHRASSSDGSTWAEHGAIDLGWATSGEVNPAVVHEGSGVLTMTYQRSGAFIARSGDGGLNWDDLRTPVSSSWAALPRVTYRPNDGAYLVTYQINPSGDNNLDVVAKKSTDPYDWSPPEIPISADVNSHDSRPEVLADGTFVVAFARQAGSVFDVSLRTSHDGVTWNDRIPVTSDSSHYDTQPHPLPHLDPNLAILTWSHQVSPQPYVDHDVMIETDFNLLLRIFCDGFETGNFSGWSSAVL